MPLAPRNVGGPDPYHIDDELDALLAEDEPTPCARGLTDPTRT
jgi:hypothetical protein